MGLVTFGPPSRIVLELAELSGVTIFVETGTCDGQTTRWASQHFESVVTIEKADRPYKRHSSELNRLRGVTALLGDSAKELASVVATIGDEKAIFYLDAHWSAADTEGADNECPLLGELACLSHRQRDIILIDDARLFLCAPPRPHQPSEWPTIAEVVHALSRPNGDPFVQVIDDVIFAIPNEEALKRRLVDYAQERANCVWQEFSALQRATL